MLKLQYPDSFKQAEEPFRSELYITPKAKGLGIIGMAEIVLSIFFSKEIKDRNGNPASLIQLANAFEYIFNFSFGNIYEKRSEISNRKSYNITKALDFLRNILVQKSKNSPNEKDEKR